jgi:chaperone modulatory protein CbpM
MRKQMSVVTGTVLDRRITLTLSELCHMCDTSIELVIDMVDEGIVDPTGRGPEEWHFTGEAVQRVQIVRRLTEDLRVNLPGAALALELMDELETVRQQPLKYRSAPAERNGDVR